MTTTESTESQDSTQDSTEETLERVQRLIRAATGLEYPDGRIVDNLGVGIVEPGYRDDGAVWVTGNWNPDREHRDQFGWDGQSIPERLGTALERIGVETLWLDEWDTCINCYRAVRTQPSSYHWRPFHVFIEAEGLLCGICLRDNLEDWLEDTELIDNPGTALTFDVELEDVGFSQYQTGFESGFHPGQDDKPEDIYRALKEQSPDREVLFMVDSTGQFDMRFSVWVRDPVRECDHGLCVRDVFPNSDSMFCEQHQEYEEDPETTEGRDWQCGECGANLETTGHNARCPEYLRALTGDSTEDDTDREDRDNG